MNDLRAAAQQALEALEQCGLADTHRSYEFEHAARAALRAALAQQEQDTDCHAQGICQRSGYGIGTITPAELSAALGWPGGISEPVLDKAELLRMVAQQEQEPVAWIQPDHLQKARQAPFLCRVEPTQRCADFVPIFTRPPRREWRGLTEEEINAALPHEPGDLDFVCARAIEQALRSRNEQA